MKIDYTPQQTQDWFQLKKGKIGGTKFGQVISGKKNRLIYELLNERLMEWLLPDDFTSDEMQFGIDHEPIARQLYSDQSGINFEEVGCIISDFSNVHIASPDGLNQELGIVLEIKCTENGAIHIQRYFEGVESSYLPQIINYFAVSDEVLEVHWVSYCPDCEARPLVVHKFNREQFKTEIDKGRGQIAFIESQLDRLENEFKF